MIRTPLHIAFVGPLKPRVRKLHFYGFDSWCKVHSGYRVSGGWCLMVGLLWMGHPMLICSRQACFLRSIVGALTINVVLIMFFVRIIGKLSIERWGIYGFNIVKIDDAASFASAAIATCLMFSSIASIIRQTQFSGPFWYMARIM